MRIAVVGLWHLGTVTAACLASAGFKVIGFDENAETISSLKRGELPVNEPGLEKLIRRECKTGRLLFSFRPGDLVSCDIIWIAYDTPVDENDQADVELVIQKVSNLFRHVGKKTLFIISSQLSVGSTLRLEEAYQKIRPEGTASFAYFPENLRLGKAIETFTSPERIVVGVRAEKDKARIQQLLNPFCERIEWMSVESAEMTKHALNAFLATSVVFINELSGLCERVGADAREVERGLKSEGRIGPRAYLRAGSAFSGGTLARDVAFLVNIGHREGLSMNLCSAIALSNEAHRLWPQHRLMDVFGSLCSRCVAVLGLTYKPGTNTLRRSSAIENCRWLSEQGARVVAFDPSIKTLPLEFTKFIELRPSIQKALKGAEALLVATEWPEFASIRAKDIIRWMAEPIVLDPGRFLEANLASDSRIRYFAVGKAT